MVEDCQECGFAHDGPICSCGGRLYLKGGFSPRWQHVHYSDDGDHEPAPKCSS